MNQSSLLRLARSTKELYVGKAGAEYAADSIVKQYREKLICCIADSNTWAVAGVSLFTMLELKGAVLAAPCILPGVPVLDASYNYVLYIKEYLKKCTATESVDRLPVENSCSTLFPLVIGSGTLNDLVKRACGELGLPYMVFATAASVDGYASDGAALLVDGFKKTLPCPAPEVIIADEGILTEAPSAMTAAGYADLFAKKCAGADWIIADIAEEAPIQHDIWELVQKDLESWLALPCSISNLYSGLTAAGIAMQRMQDSRPVSGAEHLLSHIWEMSHLEKDGIPVSHGFKVAIGSLTMLKVFERIIAESAPDVEACCAQYPTLEEFNIRAEKYFSGAILKVVKKTLIDKYPSQEQLKKRLTLLHDNWNLLQNRLSDQLPDYHSVEKAFIEMGCPVIAEDIGLTNSSVIKTLKKAQLIRNRYTSLDLLVDTGWLDRYEEYLLQS